VLGTLSLSTSLMVSLSQKERVFLGFMGSAPCP
jgi:hypothetical protein